MLILSSKIGETLVLEREGQEPITISLLDRKGNQVRIGVQAPKDIHVCREELLETETDSHPS